MVSIEKFVPKIIRKTSPGNSSEYAIMIVYVSVCDYCGRRMVYNSDNPTFPFWKEVSFETQLKKAGWVQTHSIYHDKNICKNCFEKGVEKFQCALCNKNYPTSDIQESFGDPAEYLCVHCYKTATAYEWETKSEELSNTHQYDNE